MWRENDRWVDVRSDDINVYIKEITGGPFTAKDFRTWDATLPAAVCRRKRRFRRHNRRGAGWPPVRSEQSLRSLATLLRYAESLTSIQK